MNIFYGFFYKKFYMILFGNKIFVIDKIWIDFVLNFYGFLRKYRVYFYLD